jgi:hypothetical protein
MATQTAVTRLAAFYSDRGGSRRSNRVDMSRSPCLEYPEAINEYKQKAEKRQKWMQSQTCPARGNKEAPDRVIKVETIRGQASLRQHTLQPWF